MISIILQCWMARITHSIPRNWKTKTQK